MSESPVKTERLEKTQVKVRRYVTSDIPKILDLIKGPRDRIKFILENNVRNSLVFCNVMIDFGDLVGVLLAKLDGETIGRGEVFYISPEYRQEEDINEFIESYLNWGRERNAMYVEFNNYYMPELELDQPHYKTYRLET